jgi:putative ABC transport system permease protein
MSNMRPWLLRRHDIDIELEGHLQLAIDDLVRTGVPPGDARRRALASLGGFTQTVEAYHERRRFSFLEFTMHDIRYAVRGLLRARGFTLGAVLTLALGIGANTTMFSVLNTYLFRGLPYPESDRLVQMFRVSAISDSWPFSVANYLAYRDRNSVFEHMAAFVNSGYKVGQAGAAVEATTALTVTADFFPTLGVAPALGRVFTSDEDQPGRDGIAVLSDRYWRSRWNADPLIVGRRIEMDGKPVEIVGVMPSSFEHSLLWGRVDMWRPIAFTTQQRTNRGNNYLRTIARLKPGVSAAQAQQAMTAVVANVSNEAASNQGERARVAPLLLSMSDVTARRVMWFTFLLAGFVLLIACANLANLQLVRAAAHAREYGVRAALGAGRLRLLSHSLVESLVVSFAGGALSLLVAMAGVRFVNARLFPDWPDVHIALDLRVFGFALLAAVVTGLAFGAAPAWLTSRANPHPALKDGARGVATGWRRARYGLVAGQIAFSLLLLTGAVLFVRGIQRFVSLDPGWRVDGLLTGRMAPTGPRYATPAQRFAYFDEIERRLRVLPGVQDVALSRSETAGGYDNSGDVIAEGHDNGKGPNAEMFIETASLRFFDTLGIRLLAGRLFNAGDTADSPAVTIINESAAKRLWPGQNPIGRRVGRPGPNAQWAEVIGVVNDVKYPATIAAPYSTLQGYRPLAQIPIQFFTITLRTSVSPELLTEPLRRTIAEIDPTQLVANVRTERLVVERGLGNISLVATLLAAFAVLGLVLSAIGVYGVTSYTVTQRTNEIGIRMALGAHARDVLKLVMAQGVQTIGMGLLAGAAGAYVVARVLSSLLPTLPLHDPAAASAVAVALVGFALVACYLPARRAASVDPLIALRAD